MLEVLSSILFNENNTLPYLTTAEYSILLPIEIVSIVYISVVVLRLNKFFDIISKLTSESRTVPSPISKSIIPKCSFIFEIINIFL